MSNSNTQPITGLNASTLINPDAASLRTIQSLGLQPHDRNPQDYLRYVAKIFTAFRDPDQNVLNFDPFDASFQGETSPTGETTELQATLDKSVIAYIDGFQIDYGYKQIVAQGETSEDLVLNPEEQTHDPLNSKIGNYHVFSIKPGVAFIDNQLVQIKEDTNWIFKKAYQTEDDDNNTVYPIEQFNEDPNKIWSLARNKNYKIILSYEYINQQESAIARIQFITQYTAVDAPYLLLGTFSTDDEGYVHRTKPVEDGDKKQYFDYTEKDGYSYLRDLNPQYLDKKYMLNHKNLFKHLKSQLLTEFTSGEIANTFHAREITEDIDLSVSSGDFVYWNDIKQKWYPAETSRQQFDKVMGLYLHNRDEGTDFLFTSGIVKIDSRYRIFDADNLILKNLIPGTEYFLEDDRNVLDGRTPFIAPLKITDNRGGQDNVIVSSSVSGLIDNLTITMENVPQSVLTDRGISLPALPDFEVEGFFEFDAKLGSNGVEQELYWDIDTLANSIPLLKDSDTGSIRTDLIQFQVKVDPVEARSDEELQKLLKEFDLQDGDIKLKALIDDSDRENIVYENFYIDSSTPHKKIMLLSPSLTDVNNGLNLLMEAYGVKDSDGDIVIPKVHDTYDFPGIKSSLESIVQNIEDVNVDDTYTIVLDGDTPVVSEDLGLEDTVVYLADNKIRIRQEIDDIKDTIDDSIQNREEAKLRFKAADLTYQREIDTLKAAYEADELKFINALIQKQEVETDINLVQSEINATQIGKDLTQDAIDSNNLEITNLSTNIGNWTTEKIIEENLQITKQNELSQKETSLITTDGTMTSTWIEIKGPGYVGEFNYASPSYITPFYSDSLYEALLPALHANNIESLFKSEEKIKELKVEKQLAKSTYDTQNAIYITFRDNNLLSQEEETLKIQEVVRLKDAYEEVSARLTSAENERAIYYGIYTKYNNKMDSYFNSPKVEMFTSNPDGDTNKIEVMFALDKAFDYDTEIFYISGHEGVQESIQVPAGTLVVNQTHDHGLLNTNLEDGQPTFSIKNTNGDLLTNEYFNVNRFNHTWKTTEPAINKVITLSPIRRDQNIILSLTENRVDSDFLNNIKSHFDTLDADYTQLSTLRVEIDLLQEQVDDTKANILRLDNQVVAAESQKQRLNNEIVSYTQEVNNHNDRLDVLTGATQGNIDITGVTKNLTQLNSDLIILNGTTIPNRTTERDLSLAALNAKIQEYEDAANAATREYIEAVNLHKDGIASREVLIEKIDALYELYAQKSVFLKKIQTNLKLIIESGVFELPNLDPVLLQNYQTDFAMEELLMSIYTDVQGLPKAVYQQGLLEFTIGTPGLVHPEDLTPWIFVDSRGKITSRKYPGATSVGIALDTNTLILNIRQDAKSQVSDMLNVYGNANNMVDQLRSTYYQDYYKSAEIDISDKTQVVEDAISLFGSKLQEGSSADLSTDEKNVIGSILASAPGRRLLTYLISAKYWGNSQIQNPCEYLYGKIDTDFWNQNNTYLVESNFYSSIQTMMTTLSLSAGDITVLKKLFSRNKVSSTSQISFNTEIEVLSLVRDSITYVPYQDSIYNTEIKNDYGNLLISKLLHARYIELDDPALLEPSENTDILPFGDPPATEEASEFVERISNANDQIIAHRSKLDTSRATRRTKIDNNIIYNQMWDLCNQLIYLTIEARDFARDWRTKLLSASTSFQTKIENYNKLSSEYRARLNKLPNVMWDIFRIDNHQRKMWNYTYLYLKIKDLQNELNNTTNNRIIQYSPINSALNKQIVIVNTLTQDPTATEAQILAAQAQLDSIKLEKQNKEGQLSNYIGEFNKLRVDNNEPVISSSTETIIFNDDNLMYIQNPEQYQLSFQHHR